MSLEDKCKNLYRHELESAETLNEMVNEYSLEDIDSKMVDVGKDLISKSESAERKKTILILSYRIGETMDSGKLVKFAEVNLEEWQKEHGG